MLGYFSLFYVFDIILHLARPGGAQDSRTFFSNPSRKFDVTSGPKNEDFNLRTAEKILT